jgi:hypothetical protein
MPFVVFGWDVGISNSWVMAASQLLPKSFHPAKLES